MSEWNRLDGRIVLVHTLVILAPLIPIVLVMLATTAGAGPIAETVGIWIAGTAVFGGRSAANWYLTSYRITDERFELREGVLSRNRRWIPRDRIRSVDLTADPVHRLFGLTVVKIGTGQSGDTELRLDSLRVHDAELLRRELLGSPAESTVEDNGTLATLRPGWLAYGALNVSFIAIVWGAIGSAFGSFYELLESFGAFAILAESLRGVPLWLSVLGGAVSAAVTGVLGALLVSVAMWWGFSLTRENTTLRVRRGLFTTRSVTLEERRLRGVEVSEPLLVRWAGGARTDAVATGLNEDKEKGATESKALLPPAPRRQALRVAAAVLREPRPPWETGQLRGHPRAALRRRITWALAAALVPTLAAVVVALLGWFPAWGPWAVGAVAGAAGIAAAHDAYRNLGHALTDHYLIARRGTAIRRTVALRRDGIIGWRLRQSVFQRRSGLINVAATTAAGSGVYQAPDIDTGAALDFADQTVPGLLRPFLESAEHSTPGEEKQR